MSLINLFLVAGSPYDLIAGHTNWRVFLLERAGWRDFVPILIFIPVIANSIYFE